MNQGSSRAGTSSATYLNNGWEASRTLPGGAYTDYSYNAVGALTGQTNYTSTGSILAQYTSFAYDGVFNPTAQSSTVPGSTSRGGNLNWTYDSKDRVTQEVSTRQGGYTYNFAYDAAGNPTENLSTNWHVNSDNQRTGVGNVYDGNGNPTTYVLSGFPTYSMTYDPENRPLSIGAGWSATYGADGLRSSKTGSGTTTYYLYDQGEPIIELNSSGTVTATNVYAPDGLVARNQPSVGWVMYAFDPEGNAAQRFSSSGTVYAWTDYWLYGTASSTGPGISDTFGFEARYGYILDRELGWLHYCQNRYYENQSGRWLTRDPAGPAGGIDLYEYAGANPLRNIDPAGLWYVCLGIGGNASIFIVGFWGSAGLCFDGNGHVGTQESVGYGLGPGLGAGVGYAVGGGQGNLENGISHASSIVGWGGAGLFAGGEIDLDCVSQEIGFSGGFKGGYGAGLGFHVGLANMGMGTWTATQTLGKYY